MYTEISLLITIVLVCRIEWIKRNHKKEIQSYQKENERLKAELEQLRAKVSDQESE